MLARLRHWLKKPKATPPPAASFSVTCACGRQITGPRLQTPQDLVCPTCRAVLFILPAGAWLDHVNEAGRKVVRRTLTIRDLFLPLLASALALALLVLAYRTWIGPLFPPPSAGTNGFGTSWQERLVQGQKLLGEGSFHLALEQLRTSGDDLASSTLTAAERRTWRQARRQAALLADLLSESLEDIVRHAAGVKEREWHEVFRHRLLGKSLLLDADFKKPAGEGWTVDMPVFHGQERVRVVVDNLSILAPLPASESQRLVLGVRLASVGLELPGPAWVVRFQPESGVWVTDPAAAARVCPALAEPDALSVLEEQERWIE
jgi:hypothetical protein